MRRPLPGNSDAGDEALAMMWSRSTLSLDPIEIDWPLEGE